MAKRRQVHESPKGQVRAIQAALRQHGFDPSGSVADLLALVKDAALAELFGDTPRES